MADILAKVSSRYLPVIKTSIYCLIQIAWFQQLSSVNAKVRNASDTGNVYWRYWTTHWVETNTFIDSHSLKLIQTLCA
jgi:hypothetical protein